MRVVIQRVSAASVTVEGKLVSEIANGLLVLCGFEENDSEEDFHWIAKKIIQLRIFNDENGVMNFSLNKVEGNLLIVSQFTLHASTKKGNRPSYIKASKPIMAQEQYQNFCEIIEKELGKKVQKGIFATDMKVSLLNDGPVTIFIDSKNKE